jgi:hypothetical protein
MEDNYKANWEINKIKRKFADLQKYLSSSQEKVAKLQLDLSSSQEAFGACFVENEDSQDLFDSECSEEPKNKVQKTNYKKRTFVMRSLIVSMFRYNFYLKY